MMLSTIAYTSACPHPVVSLQMHRAKNKIMITVLSIGAHTTGVQRRGARCTVQLLLRVPRAQSADSLTKHSNSGSKVGVPGHGIPRLALLDCRDKGVGLCIRCLQLLRNIYTTFLLYKHGRTDGRAGGRASLLLRSYTIAGSKLMLVQICGGKRDVPFAKPISMV